MRYSFFIICFISFSFLAQAQNGKKLNIDKKTVAVQGYDVVSYFSGKATMGYERIQSEYQGIKYYFASLTNKEIFDKNPEYYLPEYGGWCAYAMGIDGSKVKIDPETFKISNNKLYLFYNFKGYNTLTPWNENEASLKSSADKYWDIGSN